MSDLRRSLRVRAVIAVQVVVVAGLVAVSAQPAAAAVGDALGADHYLVSRADAGTSDQSVLSDDGQHVVFRSTEALVPEDLNGVADVYLATAEQGSADPFSGAPVLVSRASSGGIANGPSSEPALSADGRYIVFTSTATNLVEGGAAAGRRELYIRDTVLGHHDARPGVGGARRRLLGCRHQRGREPAGLHVGGGQSRGPRCRSRGRRVRRRS